MPIDFVNVDETWIAGTRDRIKSTSKTLSLTFGHLVEYRGFIRLGPIQVMFMPRLDLIDGTAYPSN